MHQPRPCPDCGGTDRFYYIEHPHDGSAPFWHCRQCGHVERTDDNDRIHTTEYTPGAPRVVAGVVLTPEWQAAIERCYAHVAELCHAALFSREGRDALTYLRRRGLSDDTITRYQLGYCGDGAALMRQLDRDDWQYNGITTMVRPFTPASFYDCARLGGLRKPGKVGLIFKQQCIVFPYQRNGAVAYLRSRHLFPKPGEPKYLSPAAPQPGIFFNHDGIATTDRVILTEGEIKALVALQEYHEGRLNYPTVATPGGAASEALCAALVGKEVILAFDNDANHAGDRYTLQTAERLARFGVYARKLDIPRPNGAKNDLDSFILALNRSIRSTVASVATPQNVATHQEMVP